VLQDLCRGLHATGRHGGRCWKSSGLIGYLLTGGTTAARPGLVEVTGGVALSCGCPPRFGVAHSWHAPAGHRGAERLKRGLPSSK
jgi:hypothetical protein